MAKSKYDVEGRYIKSPLVKGTFGQFLDKYYPYEGNDPTEEEYKYFKIIDESHNFFLTNNIQGLDKAKEADSLRPDLGYAQYYIGISHQTLRDYNKALQHINKFFEITEAEVFLASVKARAECYIGLGDYDTAAQIYDLEFEKAKAKGDLEDQAHLMLAKADLLFFLDRAKECVALAKAALDLDTDSLYSIQYYIRLKNRTSNTEGTLKLIEESLKNYPNDNVLLFDKGYALLLLDRCEEAIKAFDQSIAIDNGYYLSSIIAHKGTAYYKLGKYNEALECIKQAHAGLQANDFYGYGPIGFKIVQKLITEQIEIVREIEQELSNEETVISLDDGLSKMPVKLSVKPSAPPIDEDTQNNILPFNPSSIGCITLDFLKTQKLFEQLTDRLNAFEAAKAQMVRRDEVSHYVSKNQAKVDQQGKIKFLENEPKLKEYYEMLVGTCSSHFVSAKAASGKFVDKAEQSGIPFIESIPLPSGFDAAVKLVNDIIKVKQIVDQNNALERTKALSPTITDFEKMLKTVALDATMQKADTIKIVQIQQTGMFGLLNKVKKLTEKVFEDNCKTAAQRLGLQDALKMIACWESAAYEMLNGNTVEERCTNFIVNQDIENGFIDQLKAGTKLVQPAITASITSGAFVAARPKATISQQDDHITISTYRPKQETTSTSTQVPINNNKKDASCIVMRAEFEYDNLKFVKLMEGAAEIYQSNPNVYYALKTLGVFEMTGFDSMAGHLDY